MTKSCFEAFSARILQCGVASGFLQKVSLEMIWTCSYVDVAAEKQGNIYLRILYLGTHMPRANLVARKTYTLHKRHSFLIFPPNTYHRSY